MPTFVGATNRAGQITATSEIVHYSGDRIQNCGALISINDSLLTFSAVSWLSVGRWTMANSGIAGRRFLPILDWIAGYRRDWLVPDVLAGLALWAVMVPEGMAYAGIVGVPPIMGLYTLVPGPQRFPGC
jgi:hypothetical protein